MEKEIFAQTDVQKLLQEHIFVQLDISNNSSEQLALLKQLKLFGPPAVLFFKQGENLKQHRLPGEFSKIDFTKQLIAVKEI